MSRLSGRRRWTWLVALADVAIAAAMAVRHARRAALPGEAGGPGSHVTARQADRAVLRVCADPNNLPFSNDRGEGFENEVMALVASDLGRRLEYYWQPQRRGFVRTTLKAGRCDVIPGIPAQIEMARTTRPYYRSTYVFLSRHDRRAHIRSLDDPRLHRMRIGVQLIGDDYENPPAAQALASRGIVGNIRGFMVYGDYSRPEPLRAIVDAVADRKVDVAIVWGPPAGFFASRAPVPLDVVPVSPAIDRTGLPFVFDVSMGVRRNDAALAQALDGAIERRAPEIAAILERFRVPIVSSSRARHAAAR